MPTNCKCGCGKQAREGNSYIYGHQFKIGRRIGRWNMQDQRTRFLAKVKKTPKCWLWTGAKRHTYGSFDQKIAHRISYELHVGPIPPEMLVCHHCDNRLCVNPEHLFIGTHKDNSGDMVTKNRSARGARQHSAKLTPEIVEKIRSLYIPQRFSMQTVAKSLGISVSSVYDVLRGKSWRWVNRDRQP